MKTLNETQIQSIVDFLSGLKTEISVTDYVELDEDVYTWELREPLEFVEITDLEDFENEKEKYQYFMAVEGERFFLYNGDFDKIADYNDLGKYSDTNDKFMGSAMDDVRFIESFLK